MGAWAGLIEEFCWEDVDLQDVLDGCLAFVCNQRGENFSRIYLQVVHGANLPSGQLLGYVPASLHRHNGAAPHLFACWMSLDGRQLFSAVLPCPGHTFRQGVFTLPWQQLWNSTNWWGFIHAAPKTDMANKRVAQTSRVQFVSIWCASEGPRRAKCLLEKTHFFQFIITL